MYSFIFITIVFSSLFESFVRAPISRFECKPCNIYLYNFFFSFISTHQRINSLFFFFFVQSYLYYFRTGQLPATRPFYYGRCGGEEKRELGKTAIYKLGGKYRFDSRRIEIELNWKAKNAKFQHRSRLIRFSIAKKFGKNVKTRVMHTRTP